ncbi:MAG: PP2C family protein-serine/threonine phosphatase, partial [Bryobacterales bacterium]|nr:PP2C family protein-serine/threonine phosphatase [Bryobacterales bacterium]
VTLLSLAALTAVLWHLQSAVSGLQPFSDLARALLVLCGGLFVLRRLMALGRWVAGKFLWRVRHRMAAVFFFVGALPISLGALVVAWGILVTLGPVTAHLLTVEFLRQASRMEAMAAPLLWQLREQPPSDRPALLSRYHARTEPRFPGLMLRAEFGGAALSYPENSPAEVLSAPLPAGGGLVRKDGAYFLAAVARGGPGAGRVIAAAPVTDSFLGGLLPGLGILEIPPSQAAGGDEGPAAVLARALPVGGSIPPPRSAFDWQINWPIQASVVDPTSGQARSATFLLRTRPSALWQRIFSQETEMTFGLFAVLGGVLASLFLGNLFVSFVVAVSLTRTLTRAVNDLYVGTTHVNRGDFAHKIDVRGSDQVSDLSRSFNAMTSSLERLMEDSKRRQQLEAELEIAREVQGRLFPASAPEIAGLELLGVCRPARSVSGDFFDYLRLEGGGLAISFGDISGKGISAALVMASLHSIMRTQIALLRPGRSQGLERAASLAVEHANCQLCERTAPNKFATLFFAAYDPAGSVLAYSNAGHLPPLLLRAGEIRRLEVNGTIVGAFPQAEYSATSLALRSGDLLVAYTDGVTEPENASGEAYGEERLRCMIRRHAGRPLRELIEGVMDDVVQWTEDSSLQDDMTMLAVRKR